METFVMRSKTSEQLEKKFRHLQLWALLSILYIWRETGAEISVFRLPALLKGKKIDQYKKV